MDLKVTPRFQMILDLDSNDMRLIIAALGQRLKPGQEEEASELLLRIVNSRQNAVEHIAKEYKKLLCNMNKEGGG